MFMIPFRACFGPLQLWPVSASTGIHAAVIGGGTQSSNSGWKGARALIRSKREGASVLAVICQSTNSRYLGSGL